MTSPNVTPDEIGMHTLLPSKALFLNPVPYVKVTLLIHPLPDTCFTLFSQKS